MPTWVRLPKDQWPAAWSKYHDPVCPLLLALYGHPDAGGYWEQHCEAHLLQSGFAVIPEWRSCYWHQEHKCFLVVYVDDFKLAGPAQGLAACWRLIAQGLQIGEPEPTGLYLGCRHIVKERALVAGGAFIALHRVQHGGILDVVRGPLC